MRRSISIYGEMEVQIGVSPTFPSECQFCCCLIVLPSRFSSYRKVERVRKCDQPKDVASANDLDVNSDLAETTINCLVVVVPTARFGALRVWLVLKFDSTVQHPPPSSPFEYDQVCTVEQNTDIARKT
jgi:hypothetical protein